MNRRPNVGKEPWKRSSDGGTRGGLWIAMLLAAILAVLVGSYGDVGAATGRVTGVGIVGGKSRPLMAAVEVDGLMSRIRLSNPNLCKPGQKISLVRVRTLVGRRYRADGPHPCFD